MCGLAGIVDLDGLDPDGLPPRLERALDRLRPRGPDDEGTWTDDRCALAHTRLAIVATGAEGAQPMARHGRVIVFNGMIYNFRALADQLRAAGHVLATDSDTEVLLAGWRQWGEGLLPRLVGMFAFVLWDAVAGELVLARDRFGQKPLLCRAAGRRLVFASDLRALQRIEGEAGRVDPAALRLYFALRYLPEPFSVLDGVRRIPPGHVARFDGSGFDIRRWYDLADERPARYTDEGEAAADLVDRFDAAVGDRLVADVPVGAWLSGGIDSALVVASMARAGGQVRSFTVGFEGAGSYYEERPAARRVAAHLGTDHTEIELSSTETRGVLDEVFDSLDEPFADSSAIPSWLIAREARRHVTVALSGDGADEVFGGYRKYQGELAVARWRRLPGWLRNGIIRPLAGLLPENKNTRAGEAGRRAHRFLAHADSGPVERQAGWARLLDEAALDRLFDGPVAAPTVESMVETLRREAREDDPLNAMLAADIALVLPGDMLVKVDRTSMAHGLEVRCPWLDQRVVECAAAMPGPFKLAPGEGKRILRRAFRDRLPTAVFDRPKRGFEVPLADWLRGPLLDRAREAVDPGTLAAEGLFRPDLPRAWLDEHLGGRRDRSWELWTLVCWRAWTRRQATEAAA